jgi:dipeptidyl aminopeptidase/acylaminoacyl peptidase
MTMTCMPIRPVPAPVDRDRRRRLPRIGFALPLVGALLVVTPTAGQDKRLITEFDLFRFTWIADPQMSPDGTQVAFVRVEVNAKREGYDTTLWLVPTSGQTEPRRLTNGPRDLSPRWSPDGRRLAFLRALEEAGRSQPAQIFLLSMTGGEPRQVTKLPRGATIPIWSPDGTQLAFTSTTNAKDLEKPAPPDDATDPAAEQGRRTSDVRVITRAVYRANGGGYLDPTRRSAIWTLAVDAPEAKPTKVTDGEYDVNLAAWSTDGRDLYFTSTRVAEPYYAPADADLYRIAADANDGAAAALATIDGPIGSAEVSPDGKRLAFEGSVHGKPVRSYNQPDLFVAPIPAGPPPSDAGASASSATPRNLTAAFDFDIGAGLTGDQRAPRGASRAAPVWLDARRIATIVAREGRANVHAIDVESGTVTPFTTGDHEVMAFTTSHDGSRMVALVSTPTSVGDLFLVDQSSGRMTRLTDVNHRLFGELRLTPPEEVWYESFDGKKIQTWVQKPPDFDRSRKYPLILNIHGGPHAAYGFTFFHEIQWMAAKGYVVLYPNPRGSTSYGQDFGNIIQHRYPGDDHKDLMAGVDALIAKGYIDPARLGVTGGSGGGLLTNWAVTQTDRFGAAVSQRSIADWAGFWYTADFSLFTPTWFKGAPWEDPKDYAARSPLTHVTKIKTPIMFIEGEQDLRTPPSEGGEQLFRALKYLKRPTVMVQFPGESHELSRSGQPWHRVERLQHIVGWFDKYLHSSRAGTRDED